MKKDEHYTIIEMYPHIKKAGSNGSYISKIIMDTNEVIKYIELTELGKTNGIDLIKFIGKKLPLYWEMSSVHRRRSISKAEAMLEML